MTRFAENHSKHFQVRNAPIFRKPNCLASSALSRPCNPSCTRFIINLSRMLSNLRQQSNRITYQCSDGAAMSVLDDRTTDRWDGMTNGHKQTLEREDYMSLVSNVRMEHVLENKTGERLPDGLEVIE